MQTLISNSSQPNQSEQIKIMLFPHIKTIKKSIKSSSGLYGEHKIQYIFGELDNIDFEGNSMIASGFGHALRAIISLSEIWLALGGAIDGIANGIQKLVFTMANTCMKDFSQASTALKISNTLDQSNLYTTQMRKIPYQKEHFAIQDGILTIIHDAINTLLSPITGKCPAVGVVYTENIDGLSEKRQIIAFLLEEIAQSYGVTTTNTADMMQQE